MNQRTLCRYATHMFKPLGLPEAETQGALPTASQEASSGPGARGLSRHDSKLTAIMDDQPDEDYWWGFSDTHLCVQN